MRGFIAIMLILVGAGIGLYRIINKEYIIEREYTNTVQGNWDMADRASTIKQKSEYMDKFISAVESSELEGLNSSYWYPTIESDFDQNFLALKSLQTRLHEIDSMDVTSFAYQTAIQQITEQEQGLAHTMLDHIKSCWIQKNYYGYWNPVSVFIISALWIITLIVGISLGFQVLEDM